MRDKHYKIKSFRLSDEVIDELEKLKEETGLSWNMLFKELTNVSLAKQNKNTTR